jgi:multiple sugar transport system substrate-binding protein
MSKYNIFQGEKRMKKLFLVFTMAFAVVFTLISCSGIQPGKDVTKDDVYDGSKVTVDFWHNAGAENQAMFSQLATEFKTLYPNITINQVVKSGNYNDLEKAVKASLATGKYPTMAYCYPDHVAGYLSSGFVQDLNDLVGSNSPEIALSTASVDDILQGAWDEGHGYAGGASRSFAFSKSTEALFYDVTYFEEHNLVMPSQPSWDEIWALAQQIKTIDAAATAGGRGIPFCYDSPDNLFITASQQLDLPYTESDGTIGFNNPGTKAMVNYFKEKFTSNLFIEADVISATAYGSDYSKLVGTARNKDYNIRMYVGSTGGARYSNFNGVAKAGVVAVPYFDKKIDGTPNNSENKKDQMLQGPSLTIFKKNNPQQTIAAWLFTKFITNTVNSARYSRLSGYAPIRHSSFSAEIPDEKIDGGAVIGGAVAWAFNDDKSEAVPSITGASFVLDNWVPSGTDIILNDTIQLFKTSGDNMFASAVFKKSSKTRDEVGAILTNVLNGLSLEEAFEDAEENVNL